MDLNFQKYITGIGQPWAVQVHAQNISIAARATASTTGWTMTASCSAGWQTSMHQGQTGCLIDLLYAESDNVLYKGACTLWNVEKITFHE